MRGHPVLEMPVMLMVSLRYIDVGLDNHWRRSL
jgi:hypothetical protein